MNQPSNPIVRGWKDEPLRPDAKGEVRATARNIRQYQPKSIISSDFMRDSETAQILATELQITDTEVDFNARTWDVGNYSGKPESEVNEAILDLYTRPWEPPPGSLDSFNDFAAKWIQFLDRMMDAATIEGMRPKIVVTHGRNIALTDSHFNFKLPEDGFMPMPAGYGVMSIGIDRKINFELAGETECVCVDV